MDTSLNLTTNLRAIDAIKSEILSEIAKLYNSLSDYDDANLYDNVSDSVATIIAMDYILARRLGISFDEIDDKIDGLATIAEENNHELEMAFCDMSELRGHIKGRTRR